jgi:hypothetical protein
MQRAIAVLMDLLRSRLPEQWAGQVRAGIAHLPGGYFLIDSRAPRASSSTTQATTQSGCTTTWSSTSSYQQDCAFLRDELSMLPNRSPAVFDGPAQSLPGTNASVEYREVLPACSLQEAGAHHRPLAVAAVRHNRSGWQSSRDLL